VIGGESSCFRTRMIEKTLTRVTAGATQTQPRRNPDGTHTVFGCRLKCRVGILGLERRRQSRVLDRTLQLLVQLSFGLRQENLEKFADAIHASINEQLIQKYDSIFGIRLKCRVGIVGLERRQQSTVLDRTLQLLVQLLKCYIGIVGFERRTKSGVGPTLRVTSTVELRTSTRELRNFRRCHPCILKYSVGKVGFGRRQHSRVLDRPFQLLLLLCFGLRRYTLETIADAIHASINE
ncbi:hypothetical protein V1477_013507, partial [Vespula maculifrons]